MDCRGARKRFVGGDLALEKHTRRAGISRERARSRNSTSSDDKTRREACLSLAHALFVVFFFEEFGKESFVTYFFALLLYKIVFPRVEFSGQLLEDSQMYRIDIYIRIILQPRVYIIYTQVNDDTGILKNVVRIRS